MDLRFNDALAQRLHGAAGRTVVLGVEYNFTFIAYRPGNGTIEIEYTDQKREIFTVTDLLMNLDTIEVSPCKNILNN